MDTLIEYWILPIVVGVIAGVISALITNHVNNDLKKSIAVGVIFLLIGIVVTKMASPNLVEVPNIVNSSEHEAIAKLKKIELNVRVTREWRNNYAKHIVFQQDPQPYIKLKKYSVVTISVSNGPKLVEVPNLLFDSKNEAEDKLERLGLLVDIAYSQSNEQQKHLVISQDPSAGIAVRIGSKVSLNIGNGITEGPVVSRDHIASNPNCLSTTQLNAMRVDNSPTIDGSLGEDVWLRARPIIYAEHPPANDSTTATVRLLWDEKYLYAGFDVNDTQVESSVTPRDGDSLSTVIYNGGKVKEYRHSLPHDTAGDVRSAYKLKETTTLDNSMDSDKGYIVEMKIPWAATPVNGATIAADFLSVDHDNNPGGLFNDFDTVFSKVSWDCDQNIDTARKSIVLSHLKILSFAGAELSCHNDLSVRFGSDKSVIIQRLRNDSTNAYCKFQGIASDALDDYLFVHVDDIKSLGTSFKLTSNGKDLLPCDKENEVYELGQGFVRLKKEKEHQYCFAIPSEAKHGDHLTITLHQSINENSWFKEAHMKFYY